MKPVFVHLEELITLLTLELGPSHDEQGNRETAVIMVTNEGVIDLVLNFICSCRSARIDLTTFIVLVAHEKYLPLIMSFGVKAFYHPFLGEMLPTSKTYADHSFSRLMWLKASSVYLVSMGFTFQGILIVSMLFGFEFCNLI
jgi:hypothetical protein